MAKTTGRSRRERLPPRPRRRSEGLSCPPSHEDSGGDRPGGERGLGPAPAEPERPSARQLPSVLRAAAGLARAAAICAGLLAGPAALAGPGDLVASCPFATVAPQDIAVDSEGRFWVTTFLDATIHHYSADLREELAVLPSPFAAGRWLTGIAYDPGRNTLLVADPVAAEVREIETDGTPTGRSIALAIEPVVNRNGFATARGLSFWPEGDGGRGSLWLLESAGTVIYEFSLEGEALRRWSHPEDPDGFPGFGASANATDVVPLTRGEELLGAVVTGYRGFRGRALLLGPEGRYTGLAWPLDAAGGQVGGLLRRPFPDPRTGELRDAFVCVVESTGRFAVLDATEPPFRELFDLECATSGRELRLGWTRGQPYASVELFEGCETVDVLPGEADGWSGRFEEDGLHEVTVRARAPEGQSVAGPCRFVVGAGQVMDDRSFEAEDPVDIARLEELILVSQARTPEVIALDAGSGAPQGVIPLPEEVLGEDGVLTGIAPGPDAVSLLLYDTARHRLFVVDLAGELRRSVPVLLPDLAGEEPRDPGEPPEPDRGTVIGMDFDPRGRGGQGSVWVVEAEDDVLHEVSLEGELLRSLPHPYRDRDREAFPEEETPGAFSGGVAVVPDAESRRLWVSGGTPTDLGVRRIAQVDIASGGLVPGTEFPTDDIRRVAASRAVTLAASGAGDTPSRLTALPYAGRVPRLLELRTPPVRTAPPADVACERLGPGRTVEVRWRPNGSYDAVEVLRDCEPVATLPGDASRYVDPEVPSGRHVWGVRARRGGAASATVDCELRVGPGGVIDAGFTWPARSPQQVARDPVDGTFLVAVNWPGDERLLYRYGGDFEYLGKRESSLEPPWEIATHAVRVTPGGERQVAIIAWKTPVPLGEAGRETLLLVLETLRGEPVFQTEIDPPRPDNGFVTYPTALTWSSGSDRFWFLARNSDRFVEMEPDGTIVRSVPHPSPPFQNFVFDLGLGVSPRETLVFTGAGPSDHTVTRVREMTFDGRLTGFEAPLLDAPEPVRGIVLDGGHLVAVVPQALSRLVRIELFPEDDAPRFVRGDADGNGRLAITDAILILEHLFRGGAPPSCRDAADADDSGTISLTDAVAVVDRLFRGSDPLPPPYPVPGIDPTPDPLGCAAGAQDAARAGR